MYLISWCDDNHEPFYWLNNEFLGVDIKTIAENLFGLGQENGPEALEFQEIALTGDSFPEMGRILQQTQSRQIVYSLC